MTNTTSSAELGNRVEQLVAEHIAAIRRAAEAALERAFASRVGVPGKSRRPARSAGRGRRRAPAEVAALGERLYEAVSLKPGEAMTVLATHVGVSTRELNRPMTLLKQAGRVRSVGQRHLMRYFPTTAGAA